MKIAITGEGNTDYGTKDFHTGKWLPGPAIAYAMNIAKEQGIEIDIMPIEKTDVQNVKLQRTKGMSGRGIPARKFKILMYKNHCTAGIFYCDADKESRTKSSNQQAVNKHYNQVYEEVKEGLASDMAVPMIPLSMIECWLLGDQQALEYVYGYSIKPGKMPSKPEYIWGAKADSCSSYPKNFLVRLVRGIHKKYGTYDPCREDFYNIAQCSDISTLRENCPYSYNRFYMDLVALLRRCR